MLVFTAFLSRFFVFFTILQVILINNQFPGPTVDAVTNDNIIVTVNNKLDEPFLITWLELLDHIYASSFFFFDIIYDQG